VDFEDDERVVTVVVVFGVTEPVDSLHHCGLDIQAEDLVVGMQGARVAVKCVLTIDFGEAKADEQVSGLHLEVVEVTLDDNLLVELHELPDLLVDPEFVGHTAVVEVDADEEDGVDDHLDETVFTDFLLGRLVGADVLASGWPAPSAHSTLVVPILEDL